MLTNELPIPKFTMSELLFPAFNTLVPLMFENVVPFLKQIKSGSDVIVLAGSIHSLLGFAFKTQVFNKIVWKQIAVLMSQLKNSDSVLSKDLSDISSVALLSHLNES
jgi:hypothetical protein